MSIKRLIKNEYVYSIITRFITIAVGMIESVLVARYLGAELRGINAYVSSIASVGSIVITFGMHQAYPYFRKKLGKEAIYQDYISLMAILYSLYFLIGIVLAIALPVSIGIKSVFVLIPLIGYSRIVDYISLVEHPNTRNTWWTTISILNVVYIIALCLFTTRNVLWGISILLFADLIKCIVYSRILKVKIVIHKDLIGLLTELVKYGFFPMLALLMTTLNYRIDVLMLHQYSYITDAMIGVYSLGISLSDKIVLIPDTLKGVLVSKLAKGAPDEEVAKVSRIGLWSSIALFLSIALVGKFFIKLLYGSEYDGAYSIIMITAFGLLSVIYFKFIAQYNIINRKQKLNVLLLSIAIIVDIVLNLAFIPIWGIQGAALATSIGNAVCGIVFIIYFCRKTGVPVFKMIIPQKDDIEIVKGIIRRGK